MEQIYSMILQKIIAIATVNKNKQMMLAKQHTEANNLFFLCVFFSQISQYLPNSQQHMLGFQV